MELPLPKMAGNIFSDGDVNRLVAGNSDNGGLRDVNNDHPGNRNDNIGFRLLDADMLLILKIFFKTPCHFTYFLDFI